MIWRSVLLALALAAAPAFAQSGEAEDETPAGTAPKAKKKKKTGTAKKKARKSKKARGEADADETAADPASDDGAKEPAASTKSPLFPAWGRPGFDWTLGPILGLSYASETTSAGTSRTSTFEAGIRGGLSDIPVAPGNPGVGVGVSAGQAFGHVTTVQSADSSVKSKEVTYKRTVAGLGLSGYYRFLKQELSFSRGRIEYADDADTVIQSAHVTHDLGLLILPWFSGHYTYEYLRAFHDQYTEPLLEQNDHWLHARVFTSVLDFRIDLGPGFTQVAQYEPVKASGRTDYVKAVTGLHLFWKLGAAGSAKYAYHSTQDDLGANAGTRLPEQEVNQQSSVAMPEDSVQASFFAGVSDLFMGFGVGWRYNLEILNLSKRDGRERVTTKDQGFGAYFSAAL